MNGFIIHRDTDVELLEMGGTSVLQLP